MSAPTPSARSSLPDTSTAGTRPARSLAPDLARGSMLALIAIANISWFLFDRPTIGMTAHIPGDSVLDQVVQFVLVVAVDGRAYPMFAFLFGYGMVQFYRSRIDRGMTPQIVRVMLRRRHWAMLLLGAVHALLLFMGDVLGAYAVAGLLLVWIFFGRRDRTLKLWTIIGVAALTLGSVISIVGGLATALTAPPEVLEEIAEQSTAFGIASIRDLAVGQENYLASAIGRLASWAPNTISQVITLVIPLSILLGWLAARHRVLDEPWNHAILLRRTAIWGIAIGWAGGIVCALEHVGTLPIHDGVSWMLMGLKFTTGMFCGIGYAALFGLIAARRDSREPQVSAWADRPAAERPVGPAADSAPEGSATPAQRAYGRSPVALPPSVGDAQPPLLVRAVAAVGERSLTFYLFQSLIFAPLFSAWGFGIGAHVGTAAAVAIALAVWAVGIVLAWQFARRGKRGPAEVVLRRMTYGKHA